ncbi:hypothetical protein DPQ22_06780 [Candidatus Tokpelaia sp.]|nr:hypothetical protein DPQ22_06780 [Candidatus Tokpelaia sp.]
MSPGGKCFLAPLRNFAAPVMRSVSAAAAGCAQISGSNGIWRLSEQANLRSTKRGQAVWQTAIMAG